MSRIIATTFLILTPVLARADVVDSAANGFTVKTALNIQAAPDEVYRKLIHNVGDWWNSAHTFSGDAHNLSIDEKVPGCFCEKLPNGGGVRHFELVRVNPGKAIVMTGGMGPLQSMAATGSLTIQLSAVNGSTKLEANYAVTGYQAGGMNTLAAPVDGVLAEQFTRLKNYIEKGKPAP